MKNATGFNETEFPLGEQQRLIKIFLLDKSKKAEVIAELEQYRDSYSTEPEELRFGKTQKEYAAMYQKAIDFIENYKDEIVGKTVWAWNTHGRLNEILSEDTFRVKYEEYLNNPKYKLVHNSETRKRFNSTEELHLFVEFQKREIFEKGGGVGEASLTETEKKYIYDGKEYTEKEFIDFADASSEYDRRDASDSLEEYNENKITTIEQAIQYLGVDDVQIKDFAKDGRINWADSKHTGLDPRLSKVKRDDLDAFEQRQYDDFKVNGHGFALQVIINSVEGDTSQLSEKLSEIAEAQMEESDTEFAKGGGIDDLEKELHKLQRDLNSSRLQTYIEGDNSEDAMSRENERNVKLARFNEVLKLLNEKDSKHDNGGGVSRIEKMLSDFESQGRAFSNINENDTEFYEKLNYPIDKLGVSSQTGNDIIYYNTDTYSDVADALKGKPEKSPAMADGGGVGVTTMIKVKPQDVKEGQVYHITDQQENRFGFVIDRIVDGLIAFGNKIGEGDVQTPANYTVQYISHYGTLVGNKFGGGGGIKKDWTKPEHLKSKKDREDLAVVKDYYDKGQYENARNYASQLDTIVRDAIPVNVLVAIGFELTPAGKQRLEKGEYGNGGGFGSQEFSVEDGIKTQREQLDFWKKILKPKVYSDLEKWATENNDKKKSGYDIIRGTDLDNYIGNYFNNYTPKNEQGGVMAEGGSIMSEISKLKKKLIAKVKAKGFTENFGQKEVRQLQDKYGYTPEVAGFDNWLESFDLSTAGAYADGGIIKPSYFKNSTQEILDKAAKEGLTAIENDDLTAEGLIAKMIEWDEAEHGVDPDIYDMTKAELEKSGKSMPEDIRRKEYGAGGGIDTLTDEDYVAHRILKENQYLSGEESATDNFTDFLETFIAKVGYKGKTAGVAYISGGSYNNPELITKKILRSISEHVMTKGIESIDLFTNAGVELHSEEMNQTEWKKWHIHKIGDEIEQYTKTKGNKWSKELLEPNTAKNSTNRLEAEVRKNGVVFDHAFYDVKERERANQWLAEWVIEEGKLKDAPLPFKNGGGINDEFYIAYSSWFDTHPYDIEKIKNAVEKGGGKNIHTENEYGESNMPEVVVFENADNLLTVRAEVEIALETEFIHIRKKDWSKKPKMEKGGGVGDEITATYIREDDWHRRLYKGSNDKIYVDVDGTLHTITSEGEPNYPVRNVKKIDPVNETSDADKFHYMMLSRLRSDCDYFLGHGGRHEKHLWAGNVDDHIKEMKRLWNIFPKDKKPEWLSMDDILEYEKKMKSEFAAGGGVSNAVKEELQKTIDQLNKIIIADNPEAEKMTLESLYSIKHDEVSHGVIFEWDSGWVALINPKHISVSLNNKLMKLKKYIDSKEELSKGGGVGRHFVGNFNEEQLKSKEDKVAIEKAMEETGLKYIDSKIVKKKGETYMEVYLTPNFAKGGNVYSNEIKYKGVTITKSHQSGMYEYYSHAEKKVLHFDKLKDIKTHIDEYLESFAKGGGVDKHESYEIRFEKFINELQKLTDQTGIAISDTGCVWDGDGEIVSYSDDYSSGDITPNGRKTRKDENAHKNFYKFIEGLEKITNKYGIVVSIVGGIIEDQKGKYDKDETSGDIYFRLKDEYAKGGNVKGKKEYNRDVEAYKWFVVHIPTKKAITGFEFRNDAKDILNDFWEDRKDYKVVSERGLKLMGVENPKEGWYEKRDDGSKFDEGGNIRCEVGQKVQSVMIPKQSFSKSEAKAWTKKHKLKSVIDVSKNFYRFRQINPKMFKKDSFRTIEFGKGIKAVIGCPKR